MSTIIKIRRDTAAAWTAANPILAGGEIALETDSGRLKIGNGAARWVALPYEVARSTVETLSTTVAQSATQGQLTDAIAGIVGGSPTNLRNLAELAGAVGADENLSDTLNGLLAQKLTKPTGGLDTPEFSPAVRATLASVANHTAQLTMLQATVDQILNPPSAVPSALTLTTAAADGRVTITRAGGESTTSSGAATSTTYALYRGTTATGTPIATTFPFVDFGLTNGTAVSYVATARNNLGVTTSSVVTATPTAVALVAPLAAFRAADITGVADLAPVSSVPGAYGTTRSWAMADAAYQPTYRASLDGRPALACATGALVASTGMQQNAATGFAGFVIARVYFTAAPNFTEDQGIIAAMQSSPNLWLWSLRGAKAGLAKLVAYNSGTARPDTVSGLTGGAWHVVSGRWGGGKVETFINGVGDGAYSGSTGTATTAPLVLGAGTVASGVPSGFMKGFINEARVYSGALTDDQIKVIYADMGVTVQ